MGPGEFDVLTVLTAVSIGGYALFIGLFFWGARGVIRTRAPASNVPAPSDLPPVTILKPCAGADDDLEACLESYCALNYPRFQIIFGVRDTSDAAYPVIRRVMERHPELDLTLVLSGEGMHPSPKISNMEAMSTRRKYDIVWLSDSNTRVHPNTLTDMARRLAEPGVGAVFSTIVGDGEQTVGAALDNLQINAIGAMVNHAAHGITGIVASPGKSVLLRYETLEALGGWKELGKYFGEDGILMLRLREQGLRLAVGAYLVEYVCIRASFKKFLMRHLRWSQIRWRIVPVSTPFEPMLSPLVMASVQVLLHPGLNTLGVLALAAIEQWVGDVAVLYRLRGRMLPLWQWPLVLFRPLVVFLLWVRGLFSGRVDWRGNVFWMGPYSMILSEPPMKVRLRALLNAVRS